MAFISYYQKIMEHQADMNGIDRFQVMKSYAETIRLVAWTNQELAEKLSYVIIQYWIYGELPKWYDDPMLLAFFSQVKLPIDKCRAKSWNAKKTYEKALNQNEIKSKSNENQTERKDKKEKIKNKENKESEFSDEFKTFWNEFPHARKWKKSDSYNYFIKQDYQQVMKQVWILKRKIRAWLQDWKYVPACERRIRDFTPLNDDIVNQDLHKICRWHLNAWGDMKQRSLELKQTFWEQEINEIVKAIQQKDSPKNLFLKQNQ